jgi:hypothetical protein
MAGKPAAETAADPWTAFEYEVEMFYETRARFNLPHETAIRNALVPAFRPRRRPMSWRSSMGWRRSSSALTAAQTENDPHWNLNKRLAHLTSVRGDSFDYRGLYRVLDPPVRAMLHQVAVVTQRERLGYYARSRRFR